MITIIAEFNVKADKVSEFTKSAIDLTRETRKEKGCLAYKVLVSRENSAQFTFIEEWLNDIAISEHNTSPHFIRFKNSVTPILNEDIKIKQFEKIPSVFF